MLLLILVETFVFSADGLRGIEDVKVTTELKDYLGSIEISTVNPVDLRM